MHRITVEQSIDRARIPVDVQRYGSSVEILVAEAWNISSMCFRKALLRALRDEPADVSDLLDRVVECWGEGQGRSYRHKDDRWYEDYEWGVVARETFDFSATAYLAFVQEPRRFGWEAGSSQHVAAVAAMRRPLQKAFASAIMVGPDNDCGYNSGDSNATGIASFGALLRECSAALKVRQHRKRNAGGYNPLCSSDPDTRIEMLDLYKRATAARLPIMDGFINLARASVAHLEEELAKRAEIDSKNNPFAMMVVQL